MDGFSSGKPAAKFLGEDIVEEEMEARFDFAKAAEFCMRGDCEEMKCQPKRVSFAGWWWWNLSPCRTIFALAL